MDSKLKQLEPRRAQKEQLDASATRSTHMTIGAMLVYLAGQNAVFFCENTSTPQLYFQGCVFPTGCL